MNVESSGPPDDLLAKPEPGERIAVLRDFGEEPEAGLVERVRAAIESRQLTAQLGEFSWYIPILVLIEYLKMLVSLFETETEQPRSNDR